MNTEGFVDIYGAMDFLGVKSRTTLYNYVNKGYLCKYKLFGKTYFSTIDLKKVKGMKPIKVNGK